MRAHLFFQYLTKQLQARIGAAILNTHFHFSTLNQDVIAEFLQQYLLLEDIRPFNTPEEQKAINIEKRLRPIRAQNPPSSFEERLAAEQLSKRWNEAYEISYTARYENRKKLVDDYQSNMHQILDNIFTLVTDDIQNCNPKVSINFSKENFWDALQATFFAPDLRLSIIDQETQTTAITEDYNPLDTCSPRTEAAGLQNSITTNPTSVSPIATAPTPTLFKPRPRKKINETKNGCCVAM